MSIIIEATLRDQRGKGHSRRLRRAHHIPAVVYGANKTTTAVSLDSHKLVHLVNFTDNIFTSIISLQIGKNSESVIIKALQRHPASGKITHVDFLRADKERLITTFVPLNFIGAEKNSALRFGAVLNEFITRLEVQCLAKDLPPDISVDITDIALDQSIRLTDLTPPPAVKIRVLMHEDIEAHNQTVASISVAKTIADIDELEPEEQVQETEQIEGEDADNEGE